MCSMYDKRPPDSMIRVTDKPLEINQNMLNIVTARIVIEIIYNILRYIFVKQLFQISTVSY